ncbi:MAG: glycosyltransferase [Candidatus Spyradosoma sp.]
MKNILFLFDRPIIPNQGGVQRVTRSVADYLDGTGKYRTFFLASPRWCRAASETKDTRQFVLPERHFHADVCKKYFEDFCRENRICAVIHQSAVARLFPYSRECKKAGIPVISVFHQPPDRWKDKIFSSGKGAWIQKFRLWEKSKRMAWRYRKLCRDSVFVLLLSEGFRKSFYEYLPKNSAMREKIAVVSNMVPAMDLTPVDFSAKRKELLFVGRIEMKQKRPDLLLKIWAKLESRFPEWSLRLVGPGDDCDIDALKNLAASLGVSRWSLEGRQNPEPYYRAASVFCMTSAFEGFGLVLVEAASLGCVPVAFNSYPAVRDIIDDGENGFVVPAFDLDAYAETLAQLMSDDAARERFAKNAYAQIPDKFSPEKIGAQWDAVLATSIREKKGSQE